MPEFREFKSKSGKKILVGRDAGNNEKLVEQATPKEYLLHTAASGSPFVNIKGRTNSQDRKEAAIICARYSQDWRDNKKDVRVHLFKKEDVFKQKRMKLGTFGVKKFKEIIATKKEIEDFERKRITNKHKNPFSFCLL